MPRRNRHKTMKGGFLEDISNTLSGWGSSLSEGASSVWQKTKDATSNITGTTSSSSTYMPTSMYTSTTPTPTPTPMSTSTYGGKRYRKLRQTKRRKMRGGFEDNTPTTGLAVHAAPFSGPTAEPHNWVGGKTKRRNNKSRKSRRNYKR